MDAGRKPGAQPLRRCEEMHRWVSTTISGSPGFIANKLGQGSLAAGWLATEGKKWGEKGLDREISFGWYQKCWSHENQDAF